MIACIYPTNFETRLVYTGCEGNHSNVYYKNDKLFLLCGKCAAFHFTELITSVKNILQRFMLYEFFFLIFNRNKHFH